MIYSASVLRQFAFDLCLAAGMNKVLAADVADVLLEGDLLGHDTHGLQLLTPYLNSLKAAAMSATGEYSVLGQRPAVQRWDGHYLPGPYLVRRALEVAKKMAQQCGTGTIVIKRSAHIAALAAYLEQPARDGFLVQLVCSDPSVASVAPFGGSEPLMTPNPMAWGIPSSTDPILIDISASTTTNGMTGRLHQQGVLGEHQWWLDADGQPTNDPAVLTQNPAGSLQPLGGLDAGHKGYSLALFVEALTGGLAAHGRADGLSNWGATVSLQVYDVAAFIDVAEFHRQVDWLITQSNANKPADPQRPVRVPGQRGLARKARQLKEGVTLHPTIMPALQQLADELGVVAP